MIWVNVPVKASPADKVVKVVKVVKVKCGFWGWNKKNIFLFYGGESRKQPSLPSPERSNWWAKRKNDASPLQKEKMGQKGQKMGQKWVVVKVVEVVVIVVVLLLQVILIRRLLRLRED